MIVDYYAYWNGAQLRDLFEAIVAICSGPSYTGLIKSAALAGFLVTITTALFRWQGIAAKTFIFALMLFYSLLLVPKVSVAVHDERAATVHVIDNVPFGIGFFAGTPSQIGHWLTEAFEGAFSQSDSEKFSKFGAVYPQRAVSAIQSAGLVTPEGRARMSRFISGCVTPEILENPHYANDLAASTDLWSEITADGWLNPARSVLTSEGKVLRCDEAAADLDLWIQNEELPEIKRRLGSILVPDRLDPGAVIASSLPQAEALMLGLSRSLETSLKHSIMLQSLPEGIANFANQAGAPLQLAVNLSKAQGNLASEINYRTLSEIAKDALPKLRNAFEFLIIASFPLVLVMILAAGSGAGTILRAFFTLVIWIQLWAPLSAVVNYLLITVDANPMNKIISEYGGNSLLAVDLIRQTGASSQALAGSLMLLVPLISYALAKSGEVAAASMASSVLSPAQSAAGAAAGQAASGNISSGNVSLGNTNSNNLSSSKNDGSASFSDPYSSRISTGYGSVTRDGDGFVTGMSRTPVDVGVSSSSSLQLNKSQSVSSGSSASLTTSEAASLSISSAASGSDRAAADFSNALTTQLQKNLSLSDSVSSQASAGTLNSAATVNSASESLQTSEGASHISGIGVKVGAGMAPAPTGDAGAGSDPAVMGSLAGAASGGGALPALGLKGPSPAPGKGGAVAKPGSSSAQPSVGPQGGTTIQTGFNVQAAQSLVHQATGADISASAATRAKAFSQLHQAAEQIASSTSDAQVASAARSFQAALEKAYRNSMDSSVQSSQTQTASQNLSESESAGSTASVNNDVAVMNRMLSRSASPEAALENLNRSRSFREDSASETAADHLLGAHDPHRFGPSQISGKINSEVALMRKGKAEVRAKDASGENRVVGQDGDNREFVQILQQRKSDLPTQTRFAANYKAAKESKLDAMKKAEGETEGSAKQTVAAVDDYQRTQKGIATVASISLAGGLGYKSPRAKSKK